MARSKSILFLIVVVLGALLGEGSSGARKRRIVLLDFSGPQGKKIHKIVAARLKRQFKVIPQAAFVRTAKKLKGRSGTAEDVARVAQKLHADAIVAGKVRKNQLILTVRDASTGLESQEITVPLRRKRLTKKGLAQIDAELLPTLARMQGSGAGAKEGSTVEVPKEETPQESAQGGPPPEQKPEESVVPPQETGEAPAHAEAEAALTAEEAPHGGRPEWRPLVTLAVRLAGSKRSFSFDSATLRQGYSGGVVPALELDIRAYPLAGSSSRVLRGIGLFGTFSKVLSVSTTYTPPGGMADSLASDQLALAFGLEYGWRLREAPDAITVGLRFGYGLQSFEISVKPQYVGQITVPDVKYTYIDAGAFIRVPFATRWELGLRISYLPVLSGGMLTDGGRPDGSGTGTIAPAPNGSVSGLEGDLTLQWNFKPWFFVQGHAQIDRLAASFDPGPNVNATGATDYFATFGAGVGVQY